jgi:hypothetical protein
MYRRKMEKQTRNIKSVKTLSDDNKRSLPLPHV